MTDNEKMHLFNKFSDQDGNCNRILRLEAFKKAIDKALEAKHEKPTYKIKNRLPKDIKYLFHKGVSLHQTIINYESGFIGPEEFAKKMREIDEVYSPPKGNHISK